MSELFVTSWTAAYQAPPSMGFSSQEYWSGVPLPSPQESDLTYIRPLISENDSLFCGIIYGEGNGTPLQYFCLENPMDGGARWAAVHGVAKSQARLSDFTFTFHFHALEEEMATHSSVLAWRIPRTGSLVGCRL